MEVDSDAEKSNECKKFVVNNNNNNHSNEGQQGKPKRQMKTPFQLETLEKAYACSYKYLSFLWFFFSFFLDVIAKISIVVVFSSHMLNSV